MPYGRRRRVMLWGLTGVLGLVGAWTAQAALVGQPAPDFSLVTRTGQTLR